jgi:hypothetical protein
MRGDWYNTDWFLMDVCCVHQADLLNLALVFVVFGYILVENPRPSPLVWMFLMKYVRHPTAP